MNERLLNALAFRNSSSPPIWLMRQAGRYLPEFRALRKKYSFMELCRQPELAVEVTQLPLKRFDFDAAILFSDILVIAEALKIDVQFKEGVGPVIESPIRNTSDIDNLCTVPVPEALGYVGEAIRQLKSVLKVPLLGFCGAPFTIASYLIEGGHSDTLKKTKQWLLADPLGFHRLLQKITAITSEYLQMQIEAGVHAIQIFDTWIMHLAYPFFKEFSLPYIDSLVKEIRKSPKSHTIPLIFFCRGSANFYRDLASLDLTGLSLDWSCDIQAISQQLPKRMVVQGNLDPDILYAPSEVIKSQINHLLESMCGHPGYIFNLGHGIKPETPLDAVHTLVETVRRAAS